MDTPISAIGFQLLNEDCYVECRNIYGVETPKGFRAISRKLFFGVI